MGKYRLDFAAHSHRAENGWPFDLPGAYDEKHPKKDSFIYNESYNLNDSINAYMSNLAGTPELSEIGLEYTQKFELLPNDTKFMLNGKEIKSKQGIFQINDGILSVKEQYQASAIYEYAAIKLTTTVKSQVEGVADYVFEIHSLFKLFVRLKTHIHMILLSWFRTKVL